MRTFGTHSSFRLTTETLGFSAVSGHVLNITLDSSLGWFLRSAIITLFAPRLPGPRFPEGLLRCPSMFVHPEGLAFRVVLIGCPPF